MSFFQERKNKNNKLIECCKNIHVDIEYVIDLINNGADINCYKGHPFLTAIENNNEKMIDLLLNNNVNIYRGFNKSIIQAFLQKNIQLLNKLLNYQLNENFINENLLEMVLDINDIEIFEKIIKKLNKNTSKLLFLCINLEKIDFIKLLYKNGTIINRYHYYFALKNKKYEFVLFCINEINDEILCPINILSENPNLFQKIFNILESKYPNAKTRLIKFSIINNYVTLFNLMIKNNAEIKLNYIHLNKYLNQNILFTILRYGKINQIDLDKKLLDCLDFLINIDISTVHLLFSFGAKIDKKILMEYYYINNNDEKILWFIRFFKIKKRSQKVECIIDQEIIPKNTLYLLCSNDKFQHATTSYYAINKYHTKCCVCNFNYDPFVYQN